MSLGRVQRQMDSLLSNLLLGLSLAAPLGPSGVTIIQTGLRWGFLRAWATGVGVTLADATFMLIVYLGLAEFIQLRAVKIAIWALGALVLGYLGLRSIREAGRPAEFGSMNRSSRRPPLVVGYMVNISNPLAVVWWLGVFGSILGLAQGSAPRLLVLLEGSTILLGILLWHSTLSALSTWGRRILTERLAGYISRAAGLVLLLFAVRLGYNAVSTLLG